MKKLIKPIETACKRDNDPMLFVHFSRERDAYSVMGFGMDYGDALIVICHLVERFALSTEGIIRMIDKEKNHERDL